ncbi:MAG: hypothetical protein ACTSW1_14630 [Candidatus Hodarchaeales archaeon]
MRLNKDTQNLIDQDYSHKGTRHQLFEGFFPITLIICLWILIYLPFLSSLPAGVDFSAHLFRLAYFKENGLNSEWNPLWYTGTAFLEMYPPNTTFFLWIISLLFPVNTSYVLFMVTTHLFIAITVYFVLISLGRNKTSSTFGALFIMTLPSLNSNFMFFSRAPTHIGLALLFMTLGLYYSEKRLTSVAMACLLSMTHFMMFGFLIVIIISSEISRYGSKMKKDLEKTSSPMKVVVHQHSKELTKRLTMWTLPFLWVFFFMNTFFHHTINLIMISSHSLSTATSGSSGFFYYTLGILRDFLYNYITIFVFIFLLMLGISLKTNSLNWKEMGLLTGTITITTVGFLMFYTETNSLLPIMLRGMDVLRFILMSQMLIILVSIRGVDNWGSKVLLVLILLSSISESQNRIVNYSDTQFSESHWQDLNPIAQDLNQREGFFYVCPYNYQGDHMAYLPILTGKPYFDGWNPPGVQLNWFQKTPPSTNKYRPNSTLIADIANNPSKYGVKWFITNKNFYGLPSSWFIVSQETEQSKWLWETNETVSLIDVSPSGYGSLEYINPNKLQVTINTNETSADLIIKIAHHPSWKIQEDLNLNIEREQEIGFMSVNNVSTNVLTLVFDSNHVDIIFAAFIVNLSLIFILFVYEYRIVNFSRKLLLYLKNQRV